jgi:predicted RecB family nuclease
MVVAAHRLSKSRFCYGVQCPRLLWWRVHEPAAPQLLPDAGLQAVFDRGHRVGATAAPSQRKALHPICRCLVDLLPVVRDHVYHPAFGGHFGLKYVLPALVPGLGYDDLDIAEGGTASTVLEALLLNEDAVPAGERPKTREQLLAYCERDTFALVKLHARLLAMAKRRREHE